jgi:hypothetical protein
MQATNKVERLTVNKSIRANFEKLWVEDCDLQDKAFVYVMGVTDLKYRKKYSSLWRGK